MDRYDLIAIGGGTAGLVASAGAAALGLRVALVERDALGGDCLWTGCVPSKALIAAARLAHQMRNAGVLGLEATSPAHLFATVMDRVRAARARVGEHDDPERFRRMGVEVVFGTAEVTAPGQVRVGGRTLHGKRLLIATGSRPTAPPIPGLAEAGYLTHVRAFEQETLPARITVLGGGPIGLEFAQVYRRLGAEVTVVEMLPRLLPSEDADAGDALTALLRAEGITVHTDTRVERVEPGGTGPHRLVISTDDTTATVVTDELFIATGRRGNGGELGLESIGVELRDGTVVVDGTLRSRVPSVWAAGDVAGGLQFTHVADYQAKLVLRNIISPLKARADYSKVPWVTYTDPEVARVGLTETQARDRHGAVHVYRYPFAELDRAITDARTEGFVKLVTGRRGRILGATIVGSGAGELLPVVVLAMRRGVSVSKLSQQVWAYPTMAEGVKRAADQSYRRAVEGWKGRMIRRVVGWLT